MDINIISQNEKEITMQVTINLSGSMLDVEEKILDAANILGRSATEFALSKFDTDGSSIQIGQMKLTSRCQHNKTYQSPYGEITVKRHVYQSSKGGKIYVPLEASARIINGASPRFAKMLSNKYAKMCAPEVVDDFKSNHGRHLTLRYLQNVSESVAAIAQAKEEKWEYHIPALKQEIKTISISMDGAYVLMHKDGYREAMVGSISLYDKFGERQHSIYIGASPEYGKACFKKRMEQEIKHVKNYYPNASYIGIADGAKHNWSFLSSHTSKQLIDFYHVTEYLAKVSEGIYPGEKKKSERKAWMKDKCHILKHCPDGGLKVLSEIKVLYQQKRLRKLFKKDLEAAISYLTNNHDKMNYHEHVKRKLPIGSGVTEAACKTLIKQRFCQSGMRWKGKGMKIVLSLRQLIQSGTCWEQFWNKINLYGAPAIQA